MFSHDLSSCVDQVILSDGSAGVQDPQPHAGEGGRKTLGLVVGGGGDFHGKIGEMMNVNGLCLVDDDLGQVGIIWGEKSFRIHNHQYGKYQWDD